MSCWHCGMVGPPGAGAARRRSSPTRADSACRSCRSLPRGLGQDLAPSLTVDGQDLPEFLGPLSDQAFAQLDRFNSISLDTRGGSGQPALLPPQLAEPVPLQMQRFVDYAQPYFRRADQIAGSSQRVSIRLIRLLYSLAACAVIIATTQIIFFPSDPQLAWAVVAALAAVVITLVLARRVPSYDGWISARYLAERIRSGVFLAATGAADALRSATDAEREPDPNREWAERAFREISCRAPRSPVAESEFRRCASCWSARG